MSKRRNPDDYGTDEITAWAQRNAAQLEAMRRIERDRAGSLLNESRARAIKSGIHLSARNPAGYDRGPDGRLVPNEHAPNVALAFTLRAEGKGVADVADFLTRSKVVNGYGNHSWSESSARGLLANPVYLGRASSGQAVMEGAHPALVTPELFEAANPGAVKGTTPVRLDPPLLSGLLRCAGCKFVLKPDTMMMTGGRVRTYRCRGKQTGGTCEDKAWSRGEIVEPIVVEHFMRLVGHRMARNPQAAEIVGLEHELEAAQAELRAFVQDPRMIGALGADAMIAGITSRQARFEDAVAALAAAREEQALPATERELRATWPDMTVEQQQGLLASVYGAIFLRSGATEDIGARLLFFPRGNEPAGLPRRGQGAQPVLALDWATAGKRAFPGY